MRIYGYQLVFGPLCFGCNFWLRPLFSDFQKWDKTRGFYRFLGTNFIEKNFQVYLEYQYWNASFLYFLVNFFSFRHNFKFSWPFHLKLIMMLLWHTNNRLWPSKFWKRMWLSLEIMVNLAYQKTPKLVKLSTQWSNFPLEYSLELNLGIFQPLFLFSVNI